MKGDLGAITNKEKLGLSKFIEVGCVSCHEGPGVGGGMYQKLGLVEPYPTKDKGRYEITKDEDDLYTFKVPSLRNILHTAPYFHDGHINNIEKAIKVMAKHQLGESLNDQDVKYIKAFLGSLSAKK